MGCCFSCCCCGSNIDPDDPTVTAYILTTAYRRTNGLVHSNYLRPTVPKAVYAREGKLHFDCCDCVLGGYPLIQISSIDDVLPYTDADVVVRIRGSDGTVIAFAASNRTNEAGTFVSRLKMAVKEAK